MRRKTIVVQKHKSILRIAALVLLTVAIQFTSAIQVGKFSYKGALEDFNSDTITVSDTMIALSNKIYAKTDFSVGTDTIIDTPSIMFLIDNSSSMDEVSKDRNGNRFTVTKAFLDSIYLTYPSAEVGLAIFGTTLWFDPNDHPYSINFATCSTLDSGAYIPLLKLDSTYASMGNQTGLTILKNILSDTVIAGITYLKYTPTDSNLAVRNTNINAGFDAVKCAMAAAVHPNANQYVIFLSDGIANRPYTPNNNPQNQAYTAATNVPTSFTVYFTDPGAAVPPALATFTTNVRANGYSVRNDSSRVWAYNNQSAAQLMTFLMDNIFSIISSYTIGNPAQLTLGAQTSTSWSMVDSSFIFPTLFPLTGWVTPFNATISYRFPNGDTSHAINFFVKRQPAYQVTPAARYELTYWDRNLSLRYNNGPVAVINETMDSLELLFDYSPGTANYNYSNVRVQVFSQLGTTLDNELYTLNQGTNLFSVKFKRVVSPAPVTGNRIFEHSGLAGDSLIAIFRNSENPALPLDTLRIAVPITLRPLTALTSAITRDLNGNGLIDHIEIGFNNRVSLDSSMSPGFLVRGSSGVFHIDSIIPGADSTTYLLALTEIRTALPQTAWLPDISISMVPDVMPVVNFHTTDGCPPVVWEVKKYIVDSNRTHDTVKIFFSEQITNATGGAFSLSTPPSDVFHVWVAQGTSFALADTMFAGIPGFIRTVGDSIFVLVMSNGKDIGINNYINIRDNRLVRDSTGNFPPADNQRVRVTIEVGDLFQIIIGPNPARPTRKHPEALKFEHNPNAVTWVRSGDGTIISLQELSIPINQDDAKNVKAYLKIFDVVGNPVNWCKTTDMFASVPTTGGIAPAMNLYWNGLNNEGMMVAPGVYRVVVYIDYPANAKIADARVVSKVGIKH